MKKLIMLAALALSVNAFAVSFVQTTASPFVTATRLVELTVLAPFASTLATVQQRGVAGQEQLKDELVALNDDMLSGAVKTIDEVRQPALKELFAEIAADQSQMNSINSVLESDSDLEKIAGTVAAVLMNQ
ncbi:hypothetical protein [Peredibacter starrii]|uniref:Uncharacterized protein n=1 Tax=Peredibacter starrii TaxID=28202 RepID=A0AAX4HSR5_9BACT|nr:hypothetical protein [Peredibacter starrii]WPU66015.1 hypothetical protein SOO65_04585 [Peredibacter starrii]